MIPYVLRRLLWLVPVLWTVATLIWICVFLLPGDPARLLAGGQRSDPQVVARIRADWGLDDPAPVQYLRYLSGLARGDLGTSYLQRRSVARVIGMPVFNPRNSRISALEFLRLPSTTISSITAAGPGSVILTRRFAVDFSAVA